MVIVKLMFYIETYGLESKEIIVKHLEGPCHEIDRETFQSNNKEEYFVKNKRILLYKIKRDYQEYGLTIAPNDIGLSPKGIYLEKESRKIAPLFQEFNKDGQKKKLIDIAYGMLSQGSIIWLYQMDKVKSQNENYESIFKKEDQKLMLELEYDLFTTYQLEKFWNRIQKSSRFFSILRSILSGNFDIPNQEKKVIIEKYPVKARIEKEYRRPYIDD